MTAFPHPTGIELLAEITCPNCWQRFPPESALAISGHGDLRGDPMLADEAELRRFMPTRFTPECAAIDEKGTATIELACPFCHLLVPRVLFERRDTIFLSILGRTQSGKSYFLTAMARQMETSLPQRFGLAVTEPHPPSNTLIRGYKNTLFNNPNPDSLVFLPTTDIGGQKHYQQVRYSDEVRQYPRPMFFQITPAGRHPYAAKPLRHTRTICLYDNSGEHFRPGHASPNRPETEHLCRSSAMLFVFDPTKEPAFIERCRAACADPQIAIAEKNRENEPQDVILATADANVKKKLGREIADPLETPLVVILAKFDAWRHLVTDELPAFSTGAVDDIDAIHGFRATEVERVSATMRGLLVAMCPAIVAAAERLSHHVCYIPTSATGCSPIVAGQIPGRGEPILKFRTGAIRPFWAEVPLLWILSRITTGLVPVVRSKEATPLT